MLKQRWGLDSIATDNWRSLGCRTHHWNTEAKEYQQLNPSGPSNRQKTDTRPTGVQLKREATLLTVIGLTTLSHYIYVILEVYGLCADYGGACLQCWVWMCMFTVLSFRCMFTVLSLKCIVYVLIMEVHVYSAEFGCVCLQYWVWSVWFMCWLWRCMFTVLSLDVYVYSSEF